MMQQGQDVCVRHAVKFCQRLQKAALAQILALKIHSFEEIKLHLENQADVKIYVCEATILKQL